MIFSLEVLQANQGDCLILHYGNSDSPNLIIIDGGPKGIYKKYLKPRLTEIRKKFKGNDPLEIELMMVSHADDDHINGIQGMTNDMINQLEENTIPDFKVKKFWFNSFDDIIGNEEVGSAAFSALTQSSEDNFISANIASTGQGRIVRDNANKLGWSINEPFTEMPGTQTKLVRGDINDKIKIIQFNELSIKIIHPNEQRLKELQVQWDKDLKKAKTSGDNSILIASLTSIDKSPFNLSSIVCLVELGGKKILLTGDGRYDDIYAGLKKNNMLVKGKLHVDILKIPHHGSNANMRPEFLRKVTADHYVISADGKHNNPDEETLDMIINNIKKGTLHFTNYTGDLQLQTKMDRFIENLKNKKSALKVSFRETNKSSFTINLLNEINY